MAEITKALPRMRTIKQTAEKTELSPTKKL